MKEILDKVDLNNFGIAICEEVVEEDYIEVELEDLDSLEEIIPETIFFKDCGRTYSIGFKEKTCSIIKELEPKRFFILSELKNEFNIEAKDAKSEYIRWASSAEEMELRDNWVTSYPQLENKPWIYPRLKINNFPKILRKRIFGKKFFDEELFINTQELLENEVLDKEKCEIAFQKGILDLIIDAYGINVESRIIQSLDTERIRERIAEIVNGVEGERLYIDGNFYIDTTKPQFEQNEDYCNYLDKQGYKIPYSENFEYEGYSIISPKKCIDFAIESRAMHNCVGQPQQPHVKDCLEKKLQVYFLREGNRHVATIGVENNIITDCLGRFNSFVGQKRDGKIWLTEEESKIVDMWGKLRGFKYKF